MKLIFNARIRTMNKSRPTASALVVDGARILAVGEQEVLFSEFESAERQDMAGKTILPGLADAHIHLQDYALLKEKVDCETDSKKECIHRVVERAQSLRPDEWVLGHGWNQNSWPGGAWPSASELDVTSPNIPIYLTAKSLHAGWVNHAGLQRAGIRAGTPDPLNGQIQRDANGQPTGILFEKAMDLVEAVIPKPDVDQIAAAIRSVQPGLWRMGLTSVHDFDKLPCFMALQQLHTRCELHLRVIKSIPLEDLPLAFNHGWHSGWGDDTLHVGSAKVFSDGALGTRTAAVIAPYVDEPENCGILIMDGEALFELGCRVAENGFSLAAHAIGDRANHEMLDGFARLRAFERERGMPHRRHRIEHVQLIQPEDAERLAGLGVTASMQPIHAPSDMHMVDRYWGDRAAQAYPWRTLLTSGARLAFGSDAPVEDPNPFLGLHAAVTRQQVDGSPGIDGWHGEQRLTLQEAVEGFTLGPAYAAGVEDRLGQLTIGYIADLIVLDEDPFLCDPADLHLMRPVATMTGGEWIWQEG